MSAKSRSQSSVAALQRERVAGFLQRLQSAAQSFEKHTQLEREDSLEIATLCRRLPPRARPPATERSSLGALLRGPALMRSRSSGAPLYQPFFSRRGERKKGAFTKRKGGAFFFLLFLLQDGQRVEERARVLFLRVSRALGLLGKAPLRVQSSREAGARL